MKQLQQLLLTFILVWSGVSSAGSVHYHNNDFAISDFNTVLDAVDSIKTILEKQGMEVIAVIDHAANANNVGLELAPTQLILFRDRRLEKKLIQDNPTAAIDMPIKILVFEDPESGKIGLRYNPAGYLTDRHSLSINNRFLSKMNKRLKQFASLDDGLRSVNSLFSVAETVEKLKMVLKDNGFFIPFTFDFKIKHYYRKTRPATLIIFGNPNIGTLLMQNQQSVGLDLPQKFLVWQDEAGQVHITYNDPVFFGQRHNLQDLDTLLGNIANRLGQLANQGAGL